MASRAGVTVRRSTSAPPEDRDLTSDVGTLQIDWPRSLGYFGAVGLAVGLDLIPLPIGLFIAAVPFLKLFNRPQNQTGVRFASQIVEGAAKPVGGDAEGTIRWKVGPRPARRRRNRSA